MAPKEAPRPRTVADEKFEAAIEKVKQCLDEEEYEQALPFCQNAAEAKADSPVPRQCRIFALLQMSRWSDALAICEKGGKKVEAFEKSYCLYRLNRFQESLDALKDVASDDPRKGRLEAQVRYRMCDYEACAKMYEKLHKEDAEEVGLLVNAAAARVSGDRSKEAMALLSSQQELLESSYELCFNLACALIDEGKLADAETRLEEAKQLCMNELREAEELEEDDDSLEDHEELAAIQVQRALCLQRRGQITEANDIYNRVLRQKAGREVDITVLATACNNVVALRSDGKSLFDSLKRINVASKESLEHKLTRKQTIEIAANKCLLLLQARKYEEAKRELQKLRESHPGHQKIAIVQAAIHNAEKKPKLCEEALASYLKENPGAEEVLLCLAQLYAQQSRMEQAVEALTKLPVQRRAQPRLLDALATLYIKQKNHEKASACLREALNFWNKAADTDEDTLAGVLRVVGRLARQLKDGALTAEVYQLYLEKVDGADVEAICGLVEALSCSRSDDGGVSESLEKADEYARRLQVPAYDHLDAEELEKVPIPKIGAVLKRRDDKEAASTAANTEGEATEAEAESIKKKRIRKTKTRYPKGYDPEHPGPAPDPERWLPKRERAEFKKKMKKRDKVLLRGPQGTMPVAEDAFRKQGPSTAQVEVAKDKSNPRANQGKRNKGKK